MKTFSLLATVLVALLSMEAQAQLPNPFYRVQLPDTDHFVWPWGTPNRVEERERPDFSVQGGEDGFYCTAEGAFRPGSRMSDFSNRRAFEMELTSSLYFVQNVTAIFNFYYRERVLDWAVLDCSKPENLETEEETQERVDRALERAERARERRRARDDD